MVNERRFFTIEADAYKLPSPDGYAYDLLHVGETEPPNEVAEALCTPGVLAVVRHRLMRHRGQPVELSWSYYPRALVAGTALASASRIPGGAPRVLAELGLPERRFEDRVSIRQATDEESAALDLPSESPVFQQFRTVYADGDQPVEVSILVKGGDRCELLYRQTIAERTSG